MEIAENLMVESSNDSPDVTFLPELTAISQAPFSQVQPVLGFTSGDVIMLPVDVPYDSPKFAPVVVAHASQIQSVRTSGSLDRAIGVCVLVAITSLPENVGMEGAKITPLGDVKQYFEKLEGKTVDGMGKVTIDGDPSHGVLESIGDGEYVYRPISGYRGMDTATIRVEINGLIVKATYVFHVQDDYEEEYPCNVETWKISFNQSGYIPNFPTFVRKISSAYQLEKFNITFNFSAMEGDKVGKSEGNGITLDDDGGGHGWFIDTTPESNEEFLPTSNPNAHTQDNPT